MNRFYTFIGEKSVEYVDHHSRNLVSRPRVPPADIMFESSKFSTNMEENFFLQWSLLKCNWEFLEEAIRRAADRVSGSSTCCTQFLLHNHPYPSFYMGSAFITKKFCTFQLKTNLTVYSGEFGMLRYENQAIDIGNKYNWKIVAETDENAVFRKAIAFVMVNDPYFELTFSEVDLCENICSQSQWSEVINNSDALGRVYCCRVDQLLVVAEMKNLLPNATKIIPGMNIPILTPVPEVINLD